MQKKPELDATIEQLMPTLAPRAESFEKSPLSTIEPPREGMDSTGRRALDLLSRLGAEGRTDLEGKLEVVGTLGQGGMGLVRLATQRVMGRKVAVKTLRPEFRGEESALKLLHEGWVTGALEHPNVVPVYDIGLDADGVPLIMLKRIEGVEWRDLMFDSGRVDEQLGATDHLEWNLRILMQVCNAVAFAHSRGIVHRDLKPENVMIGEFGEVYVVDWGLAVSVKEDDSDGRFPLASRATELAGTPCYMAPEMLGGEVATERTDVYLLGAILYEILNHRPPHQGDTLREILLCVLESHPDFKEEAPPELFEICRRAMAPRPEERFESASALRQALEEFLQHRGSARLSDQAEGRLVQIEETLAARSEAEDEGERRGRLYNLFSECRFGFRAALDAWAENSAARSGLRRATETMVDYELDQDDPRAAAALLGELEDPPARLRERVEQARRIKARERQEMEAHAQVGRQMDPEVGRRTRAFLALVLGGTWSLTPLLSAIFIQDTVWENHANVLYGIGVLLAIAVAFGIWARESLTKTVLNRRISALVAFLLLGEAVLFLVTWRLGIEIVTTVTLQAFYWFVLAAVAAITVELRMAPAAAFYLLALVGVLFLPSYRYYFLAMANTSLMINLVVIWWKLPRCSKQADSPG